MPRVDIDLMYISVEEAIKTLTPYTGMNAMLDIEIVTEPYTDDGSLSMVIDIPEPKTNKKEPKR